MAASGAERARLGRDFMGQRAAGDAYELRGSWEPVGGREAWLHGHEIIVHARAVPWLYLVRLRIAILVQVLSGSWPTAAIGM
jgi:hypothetical protein